MVVAKASTYERTEKGEMLNRTVSASEAQMIILCLDFLNV